MVTEIKILILIEYDDNNFRSVFYVPKPGQMTILKYKYMTRNSLHLTRYKTK